MDNKRLVDSALSTSMMVAFAIPEVGPFVGAGIAVVQFLYDLIFPPPPVPPPVPAPPPLTHAELTAALSEVKADVIDAFWKDDADNVTANLLALNKGFEEVWADMQKLKMDGQRFTVMAPDNTAQDWIKDTNAYFDVDAKNGVLTTLRTYRNKLETSSWNDASVTPTQLAERRTRSTGLYCLISSLTISYLKAALMWKWGLELLEAWQWQEYQKRLDHWNQQNAAYQAKNPLSALQAQFPGLNLTPGYAPPEWNKWLNEPGCPVPKLIQEVQDLLDYCVLVPDANGGAGKPGLYTEMRSHWDEYEKLVMTHPGAFEQYMRPYHMEETVVRPSGMLPSYPDYYFFSYQQEAIREGQKLASESETLLEKHALTQVIEQDITRFHDNIEAWRSAAASVNFATYAVVSGDTLIGLAQSNYQDPALANRLFALNSPPLTDAHVLPAGTELKIYVKDALPWAPLPAKPAQKS